MLHKNCLTGRLGVVGFTLIELLVVVLIIGILAAVALPKYQQAVVKTKLYKLKPLVEELGRAAELYKIATGETKVTSFDVLSIDIPTPTSTEYKPSASQLWAYYPWGDCRLTFQVGQQYISCMDASAHISYVRYLTGTTSFNYPRSCSALDRDSVAEKVCKKETQQTSPFWEGTPGQDTHYSKVFGYSN